MSGKFELKKSKNGQFMFNLKAGNNKVILTSELYRDKAGALNGIDAVKKSAASVANYERLASAKGQPYFVLKAANKQVVGRSELYESTSSVTRGIASVKASAPKAKVVDLTA